MDKFVTQRRDAIKRLYDELNSFQSQCDHSSTTVEPYRSGEFDQEYMYFVKCTHCGFCWNEEQVSYNKKLRKATNK